MDQTVQVALQLYSVRNEMQADPIGTLREIHNMGYAGIEMGGGDYGLTTAQWRQETDRTGLRIISAHVGAARADQPEELLAWLQALGCRYAATSWLQALDDGDYPAALVYVEKLRALAPRFRQIGVTKLYHNHWFEPKPYDETQTVFDWLLSQAGFDVLLPQPDVCWLQVGGTDPVAFIEKYAGRVPTVHLKDYVLKSGETHKNPVPEKEAQPCPVGMGLVDMPAVIRAAAKAGSQWLIVEQDSSVGRTPLEAVAQSRAFIRGQGY